MQWMSYTALFALTATISILLYFVSNKYLSGHEVNQKEEDEVEESRMNVLQFLLRPRVIGFYILLMTPLLICGYFQNYMLPIVGSEWGLSETYIGYAYILSGIVVLLLGTPLTEFFSKRGIKHFGLAIAVFLYAAAFLFVAIQQNIPSLLIALIMIGVADSFGISLLTSYFTDLKDVETFGYDRGFGVYSLVENGAQSLGSFVFGYVMVLGIGKGLVILLGIISVLAILFLIGAIVGNRKER